MNKCSSDPMIKLLLVEDNPAEARLLREALKEADEGIKVVHSQRLCEAEDCLERAQFDVVLLDLSLPDARGIEALTRTRKKVPHLPIVVLSGLDDNAVALRAVQMVLKITSSRVRRMLHC